MPPVSLSNSEKRISISRYADVLVVQGSARRMAAELGFGARSQWEIAIAVSEAAANIFKHTPGGSVVLRCRLICDRECFEFEAADRGDGVDDIPSAKRDGMSQGCDLATYEGVDRPRGLGAGLGAIYRLMDQVTMGNRPQGGFSVVAQKLLPSTR